MTNLREWPSRAGTLACPVEAKVYGFLGLALLLLGAAQFLGGPDELQRNHIELGRAILSGTAQDYLTPAYPMFGYALIMAVLGPWTLLLNIVVGFAAYVCVFKWLDLGRAEPPIIFYLGTLGYAALVSSWNDHALWLSLLLMSLAVLHRYGARGWSTGAIAGLLWGLTYNIRTDTLILFPIFTLTFVALQRLAHKPWGAVHHSTAILVFMIAMLPWAAYTTTVLGKYSPTTTNGWGVAYLGLGLVPGNRYHLQARDDSLGERVKAIGEASPWSEASNVYFRKEFIQLVSSDPALFLEKMVWGFIHTARIGVHFPNLRKAAAAGSSEDYKHSHAVFQDLKQALGLPANYMGAPDPNRSTTVFDVVIVSTEFLLRAILGLTFIVVVARLLLLLRDPRAFLDAGPAAAFAITFVLYCGLVACLLLPIDRLNSVLVTFGIILLQRTSVVRNALQPLRRGAPISPGLELRSAHLPSR